jgi:hypothetical protein
MAPSDDPSFPGHAQITGLWFEIAAKIGVKV